MWPAPVVTMANKSKQSLEDNVLRVGAHPGTLLHAGTLVAACTQQEQQIIKQQVHTLQQVASAHVPAEHALSETAQMKTRGHYKCSRSYKQRRTVCQQLQEFTSQLPDFGPATY